MAKALRTQRNEVRKALMSRLLLCSLKLKAVHDVSRGIDIS